MLVLLHLFMALRDKSKHSDVWYSSDWFQVEEVVRKLYLDKATCIHVDWDLVMKEVPEVTDPSTNTGVNSLNKSR